MTELQPVIRLSRDLATAAKSLSVDEARYLVDAYYSIQEYRKAAGNQRLALTKQQEPCAVIDWLFDQMATLESQIKRALDKWSDEQEHGQWAKSICGIGPVIASGLLAHIDIAKALTVGHIWRFAGLDPTCKWEKKTKRPWNAALKTLCWKIGESFVKVQGNDQDVYGKVYASRKHFEQRQNDSGAYAEQAAATLKEKNFGKDTQARVWYEQGKLPPAHIHARAKRYAVKLFLSHYHHVGYWLLYRQEPPKPYIIEHGGHCDFVAPPNFSQNDR